MNKGKFNMNVISNSKFQTLKDKFVKHNWKSLMVLLINDIYSEIQTKNLAVSRPYMDDIPRS